MYKALSFLIVAVIPAFPVTAQPSPDSPYTFADFVEPGFPFITTTLQASPLNEVYPAFPDRNLAVRCLVLMLGNDTYACFDTDLLRLAVAWEGEFMSMSTMAHVSYHAAGNKKNGIPVVLGTPLVATGVYPGWNVLGAPMEDPRPAGPNPDEAGRGPIDPELGRWNGVHIVGDRAVLDYEIRGARVAEFVDSLPERKGFVRTFHVDYHSDPLTLVLGEFDEIESFSMHHTRAEIHLGDATINVNLDGEVDGLQLAVLDDRYVVIHLQDGASHRFRVATWRKDTQDEDPPFAFSAPLALPDYKGGTPPHWPEAAHTKITRASNSETGNDFPYAVDNLDLPLPNKWRRNVRIAGLDFFDDGRAAVSTFDGDIWLVDGIDEESDSLRWKRYASGLYEPMSLSIVDDQIYVFGREGIVRFYDRNEDGEADYYENFSNLPVQTGESREYPLSMHPRPGGGFYLSKGAALSAGPPTNPAIMSGFRAGGPHSGAILEVAPDGRSVDLYATGFREPYIGVHPEKGWITASDQQGHFVPSTPIYFVKEGDYHGVPATAHQVIPPAAALPLTWVPHQVDRSGTEQVWILNDRFGPLSGFLIHLSYGKPGLYAVYYDSTGGQWQGAIAALPLEFSLPLMEGAVHPVDNQLYVAGFQVWDSNAEKVSGLARVRYTGGHLSIPSDFRAGAQGIVMRFGRTLDEAAAASVGNYMLERWNYRRTEQYGSGHFKLDGEPGQERMRIRSASVSSDRQAVLLQVDDLREVMQMGLTYRLIDAEGDSMAHSVYFTIHHLPVLDIEAEGFSPEEISESKAQAADVEPVPEKEVTLDRGRALYQQIGCIACHSSDGSTEGRSGPTFLGLFGRDRTFVDGSSTVADEAYLKESVWYPGARVVDGLEVEMPSYLGILDEADVESIILYIKSLSGDR